MIMKKLQQDIQNYQLHGGKTYMKYEQDKYSTYQNYLYKRALYGLNALNEQELATMCNKKKQRITKVFQRAQSVLNITKQELTIHYTNLFFKTFFPKSPLTNILLECNETDEKFKNTLTFKDLNLSKDSIISIFIDKGILPKNFLDLKERPVGLPNLKNASKA